MFVIQARADGIFSVIVPMNAEEVIAVGGGGGSGMVAEEFDEQVLILKPAIPRDAFDRIVGVEELFLHLFHTPFVDPGFQIVPELPLERLGKMIGGIAEMIGDGFDRQIFGGVQTEVFLDLKEQTAVLFLPVGEGEQEEREP